MPRWAAEYCRPARLPAFCFGGQARLFIDAFAAKRLPARQSGVSSRRSGRRPACLFACRAQSQSVAVEGALKKSDGSDGGYSHPDISPSGVTAFLDAGDQAKEKNQGAEAALEDIKNFTGHFDGTPP